MKAALLLPNGKYVKSYRIQCPFIYLIEEGDEPVEFEQAITLREDIQRYTHYKSLKMVTKFVNKKKERQLTVRTKLIESLRTEGERDVLDVKKIDKIKEQLENLEKNIK